MGIFNPGVDLSHTFTPGYSLENFEVRI